MLIEARGNESPYLVEQPRHGNEQGRNHGRLERGQEGRRDLGCDHARPLGQLGHQRLGDESEQGIGEGGHGKENHQDDGRNPEKPGTQLYQMEDQGTFRLRFVTRWVLIRHRSRRAAAWADSSV